MPHSLDQILPSLQSLGLWTYWIIALFSMLEAIVLTGIIAPGTLVVIAGGMLAQRGAVDFFDLAWFVAAGAVLGGEISFRLGRLATDGLSRRTAFAESGYARRAASLLRRRGGFAMVIGRFLGPLSAFVPFSAAMAGMAQRKFRIWNIVSAVPYALILPGFGYFFGRAVGAMGAAAPRVLAFGAAALAVLMLLWFVTRRIHRGVRLLRVIGGSVAAGLSRKPWVQAGIARHPRLSGFLAARFGTGRFRGLTATILVVLFVYIAGAWADSVFDFLGSSDVASADTRVANILYAMRDARLAAVFGWITDVGGRNGVVPMLAGASAALLILRRFDLVAGLWIAAIGNQVTVTVLKGFFARPRSDLGYFVETSGSFPSGHAAGSVAVWAMLFYLAWRMRMMSAGAAAIWAVTLAFLIGLSRVYLIEHYLSDVLNGYLVGGLWLILGIAFCECRRRAAHAPATGPRTWTALGGVGAAMAGVVVLTLNSANPLNPAVDPTLRATERPGMLLATEGLPATTETLVGDPRQRVNLIVMSTDAAALTAAMQAAGWTPAPRPSIARLAAAVVDDWAGRTLPDPLVIPTFWSERPSALGFSLPAETGSGDNRLHVRFWDSRYRTSAGEVVFVGTLTQEPPLEWAVSDHRAAYSGPSVDAALDQLAADLRAAKTGVAIPPVRGGER